MREGWEIKDLENVCGFQNGFAFKSNSFKYTGTPVVRITNIQNETIDLRKIVYIDRNDYDRDLTKYEIKKGDLLIAMSGATTGKIGFHKSDEVLLLNQRVGKFEPYKNLNKAYLFYFLSTKVEENLAISAGAAQPNLSTEQIKSFQIPIPQLQEQQQIVSILDQAFEAIDQAKANIEKNIVNAKELFDSKKEDIFEKLSLEYTPKPIAIACASIFAGGDAPKDKFSKVKTKEFSIPIIANAVKDNGLYGYTNEARVLKPSITIAARGSGTGHTEYRDYAYVPIVRLIVLIPNTDVIHVEFLMHAIKTLTILKSGSAIPQLTVPMIKGYSIPIPKFDKQLEIVKLLNELEIQLIEYKSNLSLKLKDLEDLKKSILEKAFAGELTNIL